jgi:hypothetical protein
MKFVLFCEGDTEQRSLPAFLRRWLDSQFRDRVGVQPVRFSGWQDLVKSAPKKASMHLAKGDVIAVIALLDLYGPTFYPADIKTAEERLVWAKKHVEDRVDDRRFRQYFAVHEVEAWLLSQPDLLPQAVSKKLPGKVKEPESINFTEPPSYLLDRLYNEATGKSYKKVVNGTELFGKLDPAVVRAKCPTFRQMADDLVEMAQKAIG